MEVEGNDRAESGSEVDIYRVIQKVMMKGVKNMSKCPSNICLGVLCCLTLLYT